VLSGVFLRTFGFLGRDAERLTDSCDGNANDRTTSTDVTLEERGGDRSQPAGTILTADATRGVVVNCRDGSALKLDVVSMDEGILPGSMLARLGIQAGERFGAPVRIEPVSAVAAG